MMCSTGNGINGTAGFSSAQRTKRKQRHNPPSERVSPAAAQTGKQATPIEATRRRRSTCAVHVQRMLVLPAFCGGDAHDQVYVEPGSMGVDVTPKQHHAAGTQACRTEPHQGGQRPAPSPTSMPRPSSTTATHSSQRADQGHPQRQQPHATSVEGVASNTIPGQVKQKQQGRGAPVSKTAPSGGGWRKAATQPRNTTPERTTAIGIGSTPHQPHHVRRVRG